MDTIIKQESIPPNNLNVVNGSEFSRELNNSTTQDVNKNIKNLSIKATSLKTEMRTLHSSDDRRVLLDRFDSGNGTSEDSPHHPASPGTRSSLEDDHLYEPNERKKHCNIIQQSGPTRKFCKPNNHIFTSVLAQLQFASDALLQSSFSKDLQKSKYQTLRSNHFPHSNDTMNDPLPAMSSTHPCKTEGQLLVPAEHLAFGELHGYKIEASSNGNGLVLSACNQQSNNTFPSFPTVKQQPSSNSYKSTNGSMSVNQFSQEAIRKRELRLQKNREAARECRRKKKEYVKCLENRVTVLENQNKALLDDLRQLRELYYHQPNKTKDQTIYCINKTTSTDNSNDG